MVILEPSFGLANRIRVIASGVHLGEKLNEKILVLWEKTHEINCDFYEIFQPIYNIEIRSKKSYHNFIKSSVQEKVSRRIVVNIVNKLLGVNFCARIIDGLPFSEGNIFDLVKISKKYKSVYVKTCGDFGYGSNVFTHFKPVAALQAEIDARIARYNKNTFGLHIRRTDHVDAIGNSPIGLFVDIIKTELNNNSNANFYLSTDDVETEHYLKELFGEKIITYQKDFSRDTPAGIKDALLDMFCLAHTTKIYGSFNSSFSDVAARIRNVPLVVLSA